MTALPQSSVEALQIIARLSFSPFTEMDWMAWSGCESANPMICETDEFTVIIDGDTVTFNRYADENEAPEWTLFTLRFENDY